MTKADAALLRRQFYRGRIGPGSPTQQDTFRVFCGFDECAPGVARLTPNLTLNSITVSPTAVYYGGDASNDGWSPVVGGTDGDLVQFAAGADPIYNDGSPFYGDNDDSVRFNEGKAFQGAEVPWLDITTEDIVIIWVAKFTGVAKRLIAKRDGANDGWAFLAGASAMQFVIENSAANRFATSPSISAGEWYIGGVYVNRDENSTNSGAVGINGVLGAGGNFSAAAASIASTIKVAFGSTASGGTGSDASIAHFAIYLQDDWHRAGANGRNDFAALLQEEFHRLSGIWPEMAHGTPVPSAATRASAAYLDKVEGSTRKLYLVGDGHLRICRRTDSASDIITGYLPEPQATNTLLQSRDLTTTWAKIFGGDTVAKSSENGSDDSQAAGHIIAAANDTVHGVSQAVTLEAADYLFFGFAKPGDKDWIYVDVSTIANATAYFNISSGAPAIGTKGAGFSVIGIETDWKSGWRLWWAKFTGTVAAHTFRLIAADSDGDNSIVGDASTENVHFDLPCVIKGIDYPCSPIITVAGSVTRVADVLTYVGDDGNLGGVGSDLVGNMHCDLLHRDHDNTGALTIIDISDGGSTDDRIKVDIATDDNLETLITTATNLQANIQDASEDLTNGVRRLVEVRWQTDDIQQLVDGALDGTPDTGATPPDDLDEIDIGNDLSSGGQHGGLISNLHLTNKHVTTK